MIHRCLGEPIGGTCAAVATHNESGSANRLEGGRIVMLLRFLWPYRRALSLAFLLIVLNAGLRLPMPFLSIYLVDTVLPARDVKALSLCAACIVVMTMAYLLGEAVKGYVVLGTTRRVAARIESHVLSHVQRLPSTFLMSRDTGYLLSRFVNDLGMLTGLATDTLLAVAHHLMLFGIGMATVLYIHPRLAVVSVVILPGFVFLNVRYGSALRKRAAALQEARAQLLECLTEVLSGIQVTKVFARERYQVARVFRHRVSTIRLELDNYIFSTRVSSLNALLGACGPLIVLCYGGYEIIVGRLSIGELIGFSSVLGYLHGPTQSLTQLCLNTQQALAALDRVSDLVEMQPESPQDGGSALGGSAIVGAITFKHVSFRYRPDEPVLDDVNFSIEPGSTVAIVGVSGAGKTSLVRLLMRLYDPSDGCVLLDGIDVRRYDLRALRRAIGLVSRDMSLFSGTLLENIRFGNSRATMAQVKEAAALAHVDEFAAILPQVYNTVVGRIGFQLSDGQRQRVALARALLMQPRVLVLDEATSSIDSQTENRIWQALQDFVATRTTVIISHRLTSVLKADRVIYLQSGQVCDAGTHREMASIESYRNLYADQIVARSEDRL